MRNWILEHTGVAKRDKTRGLMDTGMGLARPEAAGRVFAWFWNYTNMFLQSEAGPLPCYLDSSLTQITISCSIECESSLIVYFFILL